MRRLVATVVWLGLAAGVPSARGQVFEFISIEHMNRKLNGHVVDYTHNHGHDRRLDSAIMGRPRDMYVYLPPGYDPSVAYPLIVFLHGADVDEHDFLDPKDLLPLDDLMSRGEIAPAIIVAPDGTYPGVNLVIATHSLWVNGLGGRFEDHVVEEVVPFVSRTYSVRPERQAHALFGISAGGYGAMAIALKHRDMFGVVATLAAPLNLRYDNIQGRYADNFEPGTYRQRADYDRNMVIGKFYFGLLRMRVKTFLEPIYGKGPGMLERVARDNPADLLISTRLQPGELAIYVNYPILDNYNFDAQDQSFVWLAEKQGVAIDVCKVPKAYHNLTYIRKAEIPAYRWMGTHLLPASRTHSATEQSFPKFVR